MKHPVLEEALKPLTTYLEEFGALITGWAGLSPSRMKAKGTGTAITPAQHRTNTPPPASNGGGHVHGPGCGHDHAPSSSSGGGVHYHGDTPCSHSHPPSGGAHKPHMPKGKSNSGWWLAGIVAAVGVGAYLINEYGKPKKKEIEVKSGDWKDRAQQSSTSEERSL